MASRRSITDARPGDLSDAILLQLLRPVRHSHDSKRELVRKLQIASENLDQDEQGATLYALVAVLSWLDTDARTALLTTALARLAAALKDAMAGAKPPLFHAKIKRQAGRPSNTAFDMVRGTAAAGLDALIRAGDQDEEAGELIASELARLNIAQPNGKPITADRIASWRHEIGAKASPEMAHQYRLLRAKYDQHFAGWQVARLREAVKGSIRNLSEMGF